MSKTTIADGESSTRVLMQSTANNVNTQTDTVKISPLINANKIHNLSYSRSSLAQIYKHLSVAILTTKDKNKTF